MDEDQFVVFRLADETYGVDINQVIEIITLQTITEVPGTMDFIEGIINLRGYVIPVLNMRKKFQLLEKELTKAARIVVVEVEENTLGMIVDEVSEVLQIPPNAIEKPSRVITANIDDGYIQGIAKLADKLVIILELNKILSKEEQSAIEMIS